MPVNTLTAIDATPTLVARSGNPGTPSFRSDGAPNAIRLGNGAIVYDRARTTFDEPATLQIQAADGSIVVISLEVFSTTLTYGEGEDSYSVTVTLDRETAQMAIEPYGENGFIVVRCSGGFAIVEIFEEIDGNYERIDDGLSFINLTSNETDTSFSSYNEDFGGQSVNLSTDPSGAITIAIQTGPVGEIGYGPTLISLFRLGSPAIVTLNPNLPTYIGTTDTLSVYNELGAPVYDPSNTEDPGNPNLVQQTLSDVVVDADGNTTVFWLQTGTQPGTPYDQPRIFVQRFGPTGVELLQPTPLDGLISPDTITSALSVTVLDNGNFALVWVQDEPFASGAFGVVTRVAPPLIITAIIDDASLALIGEPQTANVTLAVFEGIEVFDVANTPTPEITATFGSGYVISWETFSGTVPINGRNGNIVDIFARVFDQNGAPISDETYVGTSQATLFYGSEMTVFDDGRILFTWSEQDLTSNFQTINPETYQRLFQGPFASNDIIFTGGSVAENSAAGVAVATATGTFVSAQAITYSLIDNAGGRFTINPTTGEITVAANAQLNFEATPTYSITARITSATGQTYDETFTINVTDVNEAPVVVSVPTNVDFAEDTGAISFTLPANSFADPDAGDALSYTVSGLPSWLSFTSSTLTFAGTAPADFNGQITMTIVATDTAGLSTTTTQILLINPINDAPVVTTLLTDESSAEDSAVSFTLPAGSFTDVDNAALSYTTSALPSWLSFDAATRSFTGTPPANFTGNVDITVSASDGSLTVSDTFTLAITPVNDAPTVTTPLSGVSVPANTAINVAVPASTFADIDGDTLSLTATLGNGDPLPSWLTFDAATRTLSGTPPIGFTSDVIVTVRATDPSGLSITSNFTIDILQPSNIAPTLANSSVGGNEDTAITGTLIASDPDSAVLTYSVGTGPTNGTLVLSANGSYVYTPNANYNGSDSFTVIANDGQLSSSPATVSVTVNAVNDAPTTTALTLDAILEDTTALISDTDILAGVVDVDGNTLTVVNITASSGSLGPNVGGIRLFTPTANSTAPVTFNATISDGTTTIVRTVNLPITAVNDAPVIQSVNASVAEDTTLNSAIVAFDPDSTGLTYTLVSSTSNGTLTFNSNGTYSYVPWADYNGIDTFVVRASDGIASSANTTFSILVTPVNDAPRIIGTPASFTVDEDSQLRFSFDPRLYIRDPEDGTQSPPMLYTLTGLPSWLTRDPATGGGFAVSPLVGDYVGTPTNDQVGTYTITLNGIDSQGLTVSTSFTVTVNPVNDAPVGTASTATGNEDTSISGTVSATDVDSAALTYALGAGPTNGALVFNANGTYVYTPNANYNGTDSFTFRASDGSLTSALTTVTLTVAAVNDAPVAANGTASGNEDSVITGTLAATDVDSAALTYSLVTAPTNGTVTINTNGTYNYTPNANYNGTDSFTFRASDGSLNSIGIVSLTVDPVNDAPNTLTLASGGSVAENAANGTAVAQLAATDPDTGSVLTYSLTNDAGGRFAINATTGAVTVANGALLNFETATSHALVARVTDQGGLTRDLNLTIAITDVAEGGVPINGTNGSNTINGTVGNDVINALGGSDTVNAGGGNDIVNGGSGNDELNGQAGDDQLFGGSGVDELNGGSGNDLLDGGDDTDILDGGAGNDTLLGGAGRDYLDGGSGNDILDGGSGFDVLQGGSGNDILFGGAGADFMSGGNGQDIFRFTSIADSPRASGFVGLFGRDTIVDFNANNGPNHDIIDLSGIDANTNISGDQAFTYIGNAAFSRVAGQLRYNNNILSGDVDGDGVADFEIQLYLENPPAGPNPLDPTDFIL
jgi:VCBS repeat-containing protein